MSHFFERALLDQLGVRLAESPKQRTLVWASEEINNQPRTRPTTYSELIPETILPDSSRASLIVTDHPEHEVLRLCVCTRGSLAVPIATVDKRDGSVQQVSNEGQALPEKDHFVQTMLALLRRENIYDRHVLGNYETNLLDKVSDPDAHQAAARYLVDPDIYPCPTQAQCNISVNDHDRLVYAAKARENFQPPTAEIFIKLGAATHLSGLHGETTPQYEHMLGRLDALIGRNNQKRSIEGTIKDILTGTVRVNHTVRVELRRSSDIIEIIIASRSETMTHKERVKTLVKHFKLSSPMPEQPEAEFILAVLDALAV